MKNDPPPHVNPIFVDEKQVIKFAWPYLEWPNVHMPVVPGLAQLLL